MTIFHLGFVNNNPKLIEIDGVIQGGDIEFMKEKMKDKYPPEIVFYEKEIEIPDERLEILY
jgi:hypothetical protein